MEDYEIKLNEEQIAIIREALDALSPSMTSTMSCDLDSMFCGVEVGVLNDFTV